MQGGHVGGVCRSSAVGQTASRRRLHDVCRSMSSAAGRWQVGSVCMAEDRETDRRLVRRQGDGSPPSLDVAGRFRRAASQGGAAGRRFAG